MILLTTEKSFRKKCEKWCLYKDFLVVNAMERHDDSLAEFGNKVDADEFNPPPSLLVVAQDPDSKEAKIKRAHLNQYLDRWLNDESFQTKLHYIMGCMVKHYATHQEDLNVFVILRPAVFNAFHTYMERQINEDYNVEVATFITHKMKKGEQRELLERHFDRDHFKRLSKAHKALRITLHIDEKRQYADLDEY